MSLAQDDDGLYIVDKAEHGGDEFTIQTYKLRLPHGPDRDQHFETQVNNGVKARYETEQEARDGHEDIRIMLDAGNYEKECIDYMLHIGGKE